MSAGHNDSNTIGAYRPIRRIRQACDACRRRKSKCSGERPVCSYCARFRKQCRYTLDNAAAIAASAATRASFGSAEQARLDQLEGKLDSVLNAMSKGQNPTVSPGNSSTGSRDAVSPMSPSESVADESDWQKSVSLPKSAVEAVVDRFLSQVDCRSALVFLQDCQLGPLQDEDLLYAVFALATVSSDQPTIRQTGEECRNSALSIIVKRISAGKVQAATLQALCVLTYADLVCGMVDRAEIFASMAINLCETAGVIVDGHLNHDVDFPDQLHGCYWSLYFMEKMHSCGRGGLQLPGAENNNNDDNDDGRRCVPTSYRFRFASDLPRPLNGPDNSGPQGNYISVLTPGSHPQCPDHGIMAYAAKVASVWAITVRFCLGRNTSDNNNDYYNNSNNNSNNNNSDLPPWSPGSTFVKITSLLVELETSTPAQHRFHFARFADRSAPELQQHAGYWGLFLLQQFAYHTIFCLLNHPVLVSVRLRRASVAAPYSVIQGCTEQLRIHSDWVVHFVDMLAERDGDASSSSSSSSPSLTNPFLGYATLIVASACLPQAQCIEHEPTQRLRNKFNKCVEFAQGLSKHWPILVNMIKVVRQMQSSEGLETTQTSSSSSAHPGSDLVTLLLKLLDYKSVSRSPESRTSLLATSLCADVHAKESPPRPASTLAHAASRTPRPSNAGLSSAPSTSLSPGAADHGALVASGPAWPYPPVAGGREAQARTNRSMAGHAQEVFSEMPMTVDMSDVSPWPISGVDQSGMWWSMGSL
ncbi:hypothetical protein JDV02_005004 [Purpureocillium takamizusanense]|uniref:Zn(2)-C6 fungal-type domain-containing protein n=1 Tax=Purpureocillium takamizusanense TaxID=2060973 RepID=A0A9Q8QFQ0_9HYPO|nr:uncharacterized protein JDV02_005004 [Purpureocillium takamizusanense]UNI18748.1 hypothetical protein JDV02_005004 [Purpureocillium takamizusanense]